MSDTADTLRLKVKRANEHFEYFKATLGLAGGSPIDGLATHGVQVDEERNFNYTTDATIPGTEHGIIIGDVVHQLRSCLDHIVYAMVKPVCTDPQVLRKVQFPIFDDSTKFENSPGFHRLVKVFGANSPQITQIRDTQPYKRYPAAPTTDPLWIVSELDNIDKHRAIIVLNPTVSVSGTIRTDSGTIPFVARQQPIKAGTAVLNLGWPLPDPPFEMNVQRVAPFIVFAETDGLCDKLSIFTLVRRLINAVNGVISDFETKRLI